jgi:L-asparaginase II
MVDTGLALLAEVTRGEVVESTHRGVVVVADVDGNVVASAGDPERPAYFRSSAKPYQAIPLIESGAADAFGFTEREVALACSSHDSTPDHQRGVVRMLEKAGLHDEDFRCGISLPVDPPEMARSVLGLVWPSQVQCECSGEHAGMLAACKHLGYPLDTYVDRDHPLQRRILEIVAAAVRRAPDDVVLGTDGCSIPTFGATIREFALAYATFAVPERAPAGAGRELAPAIDRLRSAMTAYPVMVGNEGVLDTDIMQFSNGRIVAKLGGGGAALPGGPRARARRRDRRRERVEARPRAGGRSPSSSSSGSPTPTFSPPSASTMRAPSPTSRGRRSASSGRPSSSGSPSRPAHRTGRGSEPSGSASNGGNGERRHGGAG